MRIAGSLVFVVLCGCNAETALQFWDEPPGDGVLVAAIADEDGRVLETALLGDDDVFQISVDDAAWFVTWPIDRDRFLSRDLRRLTDDRLDDLLLGELEDGCGRCVAASDDNMLAYPGSSCAVPAPWESVVRDVEGRVVPREDAPFERIRRGVIMSWRGPCACAEETTVLPTIPRAVPFAPGSRRAPMRHVEEHATGLVAALGEELGVFVDPTNQVTTGEWLLPGLLATAVALPADDPGFLLAVDDRTDVRRRVRYFTTRASNGSLVLREVAAPSIEAPDLLNTRIMLDRPGDDRMYLVGTRERNFDGVPSVGACRLTNDTLVCDTIDMPCPDKDDWDFFSADVLEDGRLIVVGTNRRIAVIDVDQPGAPTATCTSLPERVNGAGSHRLGNLHSVGHAEGRAFACGDVDEGYVVVTSSVVVDDDRAAEWSWTFAEAGEGWCGSFALHPDGRRAILDTGDNLRIFEPSGGPADWQEFVGGPVRPVLGPGYRRRALLTHGFTTLALYRAADDDTASLLFGDAGATDATVRAIVVANDELYTISNEGNAPIRAYPLPPDGIPTSTTPRVIAAHRLFDGDEHVDDAVAGDDGRLWLVGRDEDGRGWLRRVSPEDGSVELEALPAPPRRIRRLARDTYLIVGEDRIDMHRDGVLTNVPFDFDDPVTDRVEGAPVELRLETMDANDGITYVAAHRELMLRIRPTWVDGELTMRGVRIAQQRLQEITEVGNDYREVRALCPDRAVFAAKDTTLIVQGGGAPDAPEESVTYHAGSFATINNPARSDRIAFGGPTPQITEVRGRWVSRNVALEGTSPVSPETHLDVPFILGGIDGRVVFIVEE